MSDSLLTADLCDAHDPDVRIAMPIFRAYGGVSNFSGPIRTVRVFDDNSLVRAALETSGEGAVLVVDGGGSDRCALMGGLLAGFARDNDWSGLIVNGYIRDAAEVNELGIGVRALGTFPRKSEKRGAGDTDVDVFFAGVRFSPGEFVFADEDGIVVSARDLRTCTE